MICMQIEQNFYTTTLDALEILRVKLAGIQVLFKADFEGEQKKSFFILKVPSPKESDKRFGMRQAFKKAKAYISTKILA